MTFPVTYDNAHLCRAPSLSGMGEHPPAGASGMQPGLCTQVQGCSRQLVSSSVNFLCFPTRPICLELFLVCRRIFSLTSLNTTYYIMPGGNANLEMLKECSSLFSPFLTYTINVENSVCVTVHGNRSRGFCIWLSLFMQWSHIAAI